MLISHQWPTVTVPDHEIDLLKLARSINLNPCLQRLHDSLKCDRIIAVDLTASTEAVIVGNIGDSDHIDVNSLMKLVKHRDAGGYVTRDTPLNSAVTAPVSPNIVLAPQVESEMSVLSLKLSVGMHNQVVIIAFRQAPRAFGAHDERTFHRYADWISDYIAIWRQLRDGEQRSTGLQGALDQVSFAMIMLDRDGRTVGANRAAQRLLAAGDGLIAVGEMLSAPVLEDAVRLHSAIGHALVGPMHGARSPVLTVRRKRRRPLVVAVLRVAADPQPGATAIVLQVIEPDRDRDSAITANCTLFGFTGAEARLVKQLVGGASLAEAAAALRIQMPTARTYLKQAFAKSGTNRQAALVQLLLSSLVHPDEDTVLTAM